VSRFLAHAITRRETGGPVTGLRGSPLRWIGTGELGVWVTEWSGEPTLTRDDAFAHHDLVAVLCDAGPCLPVRFGTWLATEEAAQRSLDDGEARFAAAVDRLGDRQEIAVTLLWREAPSQAGRGEAVASSGKAFLDRKRALHAATDDRRRTAEDLATALRSALPTDQADVRHETCPSAEVALSMSLLARKDEAGALKARATAVVAVLDGVRGVVSGPWPPYSFTEELGEQAGAGVVDGPR
jgi:hypothetical protein